MHISIKNTISKSIQKNIALNFDVIAINAHTEKKFHQRTKLYPSARLFLHWFTNILIFNELIAECILDIFQKYKHPFPPLN